MEMERRMGSLHIWLRNKRLTLSCLIMIAVLISFPAQAPALPIDGLKPAMDRTADYLQSYEKMQEQPLTPWSYVDLAAAGRNLAVTKGGESCSQQLAVARSTTDYSLLTLTLLGVGENPYNYRGQNLVERIRAVQLNDGKFADNLDGSGQGDKGEQILLNAHVWAILALHAAGAVIPEAGKARQWIVDQQHDDGSFNWSITGKTADIDSTGMALQALGVLGEKKDSQAVKRAFNYLKSVQENDGGFSSWGASNPESCAMVIEGLIAVGIDPAAEMNKPGGNPVTAILSFQLADGSFGHIKGAGASEISTQQVLMALSDLYYGKIFSERWKEKTTTGNSVLIREIRFKIGSSDYLYKVDEQDRMEKADAAPFVEKGRAYVPLRYLALALGIPEADIKWSAPAQTVTLIKDGITVTVSMDDNIISVNDAAREMDVIPVVREGRTFLPARYVAECFNYRVAWNETEESVVISK